MTSYITSTSYNDKLYVRGNSIIIYFEIENLFQGKSTDEAKAKADGHYMLWINS